MSETQASCLAAPARVVFARGQRDSQIRRTRMDWVDASKGLGIVLVVVGHTLRGLANAQLLPSGGVWAAIDRYIYAFHMPLFFLLSGLFLLPSAAENYRTFARRRLVRLGYPYLIWASLQMLLQVALSRHTNTPARLTDLWTILFAPPMQFWFLYALLLQTLALGGLAKLGFGRNAILAVAALLFVSAPYLPLGGWLPLYQARDALVYTALGVWLGQPEHNRLLDRLPRAVHAASALLGYAAVAAYVALGATPQHHLAFLPAALGTLATVSLCCLLARSSDWLTRHLAELGQASLTIFVAHTLASAATRIALNKVLHIDNAALHLALGIGVGVYAPLVLHRLSQRGVLGYLFQPTPAPARVLSAST